MSAVMKPQPGTATATDTPSGEGSAKTDETIDGFHLVIEALKLNGIDTVFGLPGIPITDLTRKMQAEGLRVISFRHEQHAGNAAAAAGFLTGTPGICLTVSAPGFLNGLTALANATTNCFPMILISGSSEREIGARKLEKLTRVNGDPRGDSYDKSALLTHVGPQGDIDVRRPETAAGHRHGDRRAER